MILKSMMSKDDKMHIMGKKKYARDAITSWAINQKLFMIVMDGFYGVTYIWL
jgi:hypothetical protein